MLTLHMTKSEGQNPKVQKELNMGGGGEAFSQRGGTASKKALRLEGSWHFRKAKKRCSRSFEIEDKSKRKENRVIPLRGLRLQ